MPDLLKHDYIFVTKQGLIDLEAIIEKRHESYFRNRKMATQSAVERAQHKLTDVYEREIIRPILDAEELEGYNDDLPLSIQSESLKTYVDDLHRLQAAAANDEANKDSAQ